MIVSNHLFNGCGNPFFLVYAQFHFLKITVDGCVNLKNMTIYPIRFDNPNFTREKVESQGKKRNNQYFTRGKVERQGKK